MSDRTKDRIWSIIKLIIIIAAIFFGLKVFGQLADEEMKQRDKELQNKYEDIYDEGYGAGYSAGYEEGENAGYEEGYDDGYYEGFNDRE